MAQHQWTKKTFSLNTVWHPRLHKPPQSSNEFYLGRQNPSMKSVSGSKTLVFQGVRSGSPQNLITPGITSLKRASTRPWSPWERITLTYIWCTGLLRPIQRIKRSTFRTGISLKPGRKCRSYRPLDVWKVSRSTRYWLSLAASKTCTDGFD